MSIKSYEETKNEVVTSAKETIKTIEEIETLGGITNEIKKQEQAAVEVLENPESAAIAKVDDLASTVADIKEIGINPSESIVEKWAKKELGINSLELSSILDANETPEAVRKDVLKKMEAPKSLLNKNQNKNTK